MWISTGPICIFPMGKIETPHVCEVKNKEYLKNLKNSLASKHFFWPQNSIIVHNVNTLNDLFCIYYYFYEFLTVVRHQSLGISLFLPCLSSCAPCSSFQSLCCHTRLVFLHAVSLSKSHKYFIVVQIITCYCYYIEIMVITHKDKLNQLSTATCSLVNLLLK